MKLSENIDKVAWSVLDKGLYILYGFTTLLQFRRIEPSELGLFGILIGIHTWIFILADSLFLHSIIQFGFKKETETRANMFALAFTFLFIAGFTFSFSFSSDFWVIFFNEPGLTKVTSFLPWLSILSIPRVFCIKFAFKHSSMFKVFLINASFFLPMSITTVYLYFTYPTFTFFTLIKIYLSGTAISSLTAIILLKGYIRFGFNGTLKVREFFSFGLPMFSLSLFQSIPRQLDVLFLQFFFQSKVVGIYYSAKTLFRLFEEGVNAGNGLVYPTAVRLIARNRREELRSLVVKSVSFTFLALFLTFIILELGGTEFFIRLILPERYLLSISFLNLMLFATIFMPLQLGASVMIAENKVSKVAFYIFVSSLFSVLTFILIGMTKDITLAPLGLTSYYIFLGLLLFFKMQKDYQFRFKDLFSSVQDIFYFVKQKVKN